MDLGLTGKVALIGGASKGLGLAAARALCAEGAHAALMARSPDVLEQAAEDLRQTTGAEVLAVAVDLSQTDDLPDAVDQALDAFGRIDILINNAGGPPTGQFLDLGLDDWLHAFHLNLASAVTLAKLVVPRMKENNFGRIINLTSIAVKQPLDNLILSNSIRAGVHGWAKTLASELAPHGITVNNIMPGYTLTDRVRGLARNMAEEEGVSPEAVIHQLVEDIPMGRLGRPDELGDLAAFLASERAAYITGASIPVDGGFYKGLL
jgi:3-oxoacyl-[acyl-carrier protein] reductase